MTQSNNKPNCLCVSFLTGLTVDSGNGGWSEANITTRKKITLPDSLQYPYWSGQCIRKMLRTHMLETGVFSPTPFDRDGGVVSSEGDPATYMEDDLFGFMRARDKKQRTAPMRMSPLMGCFPIKQSERDLGTNSATKIEDAAADAGGNIFETEQTANVYYGTMLIELDRVGRFGRNETVQELASGTDFSEILRDEQERRLSALLEALENLWGGGKQSRIMSNISPSLWIATLQKGKNPFLLGALKVGPDMHIENPQEIVKLLEARVGILEGLVVASSEIFPKNSCDLVRGLQESEVLKPFLGIPDRGKSTEKPRNLLTIGSAASRTFEMIKDLRR